MTELFARLGDIYRVFAPGRKSHTYVIHHPDDVKRVLVSNHRNYTKGVGRDLDQLAEAFALVTKEPARDLQFAFKFRSLTKLVAAVIQRRRAGKEEHFDFVGMLMTARDKETGDPMGERELVDEIMTLVVAGHEITASGFNWTWY